MNCHKEMYLLSAPLLARINEIAQAVSARTCGAVRFEEYIASPCFGNIILRFGISSGPCDIGALDSCERLINGIVGDEFLVDFMGSDYRNAGVDFSGFDETLRRFAQRYADEPVPASRHAEGVAEDARFLLERAGLDTASEVWEIQPEEGSLLLLLMGEKSRPIKKLQGEFELTVLEADRLACTGLMKAAAYAKRTGVSIARLLSGNAPSSPARKTAPGKELARRVRSERELSCGAVVFCGRGEDLKILLVRSVRGSWGFPKGRMEEGESERITALREIREETGLDVRLFNGFRVTDVYPIRFGKEPVVIKTVHYFLACYEEQTPVPQEGEIAQIRLLEPAAAMQKLRFGGQKTVLKKALEFIKNKGL